LIQSVVPPGCTVTLDALHAVRETFEITVGAEVDFLVCVKDNAADLKRGITRSLDRPAAQLGCARTIDAAHGRIEVRTIEVADTSPVRTGWPHTFTACRVTRDRTTLRRGQCVSHSCEQVHYVASFASTRYTPEQILAMTRGHWGIENGLHHRKDRTMDEDRNRASASGSGRAMSCLRSIAAMVMQRTSEQTSVVQRRFSAKPRLVLGLLACRSIEQWEQTYAPYKRV